MKGVFTKRSRLLSILWSAFFILSGTVIALRFGTWGVDAVREAKIAEAIFSFGFMLIGVCLGCMSILIFNFNKKASLEINENELKIVCGFGSRYELSTYDISDVSLQGKNLILVTKAERIIVSNLANAKEICEYLQKLVTGNSDDLDYEKEKMMSSKWLKKTLIRLIPTVIATVLLFVHIGWCVGLTGGRDLGDFTASDDMIFVAFALAEIITLVAAFLLAGFCGKAFVMWEESRKRVNVACAQKHRKDALDKYSGIIAVKYFDSGSYRIVIFSPNGDLFGYMLEHFDVKSEKWNTCYEKAKGFHILSDLYDDIEENFSDVVLED